MAGEQGSEIQSVRESGRVQKVASYRRHRTNYRAATNAFKKLPLGKAIEGAAEPLIVTKNAAETAAGIIRADLKGK